MKKIYLSLALIAMVAGSASAADIQAGNKEGSEIQINVMDININDAEDLVVDLNVNLSAVNLKGNKEVVCVPMFINGLDTLRFTPFSVAGHNRFIWDRRNGQQAPMMFKGFSKKKGELSKESVPAGYGYVLTPQGEGYTDYNLTLSTPYQPWMEQSTFTIETIEIGCSDCVNSRQILEYPMASIDFRPTQFLSEFLFVTPIAEEVKSRDLSGRAYVEFEVNKTNILPNFRNNAKELAKITATIDSVKNDKDITVTSIAISGTASPEGSYENNVRLAKGRTEALKDYVTNLYKFPKDFIKTSFEPVDWAGLREWLENNQIENREAILAIVNGDLEPYARNQKIKTTYPKQYQWLLQNVYPSLRHSDYVIEYNIRNYANVDEIIEVMTTAPQKLSLNELFIVANNQPEGSDLYNESFEIAVKMYPDDEVANLNAGTAALMRGDFNTAKKYLSKAGQSEEAEYIRAEYEALNGDKEAALKTFEKLAKSAKSDKVREKAERAADSLSASLKKANKKYTIL